MKKLLSTILASTMLLSTLSMTAMAQKSNTFEEKNGQIYTETLTAAQEPAAEDNHGRIYVSRTDGDYRYRLYREENFAIIDRYNGDAEHLVIPAVIGGVPVTGVAIYLNNKITSVDLPDFLTSVEFENCKGLQTLTVPDSVTELDLRNSSNIESLYLPVSVISLSLYGCSSTNVYYQGSQADSGRIENISSRAFDFDKWVYNYNDPSWTREIPTFPDWTSLYIDFVADSIMPDISPENFGFASNRGLIAQSLYNMCGDGATYTSHFTDTGANTSAIGWCFENGVMSGNSDTWFNAEGNVTREQFALILRQLASVQGKDTSYDVSILSNYPDGTSGSDWALSGLAWAVKNGLMSGNANGTLNPSGDVSRVEVAVMLSNFVNL